MCDAECLRSFSTCLTWILRAFACGVPAFFHPRFVARACFNLLGQIARVCVDKQKRLMFRGWSRLCLHVASLHVAEGAVGAGCVTTRATSAKGMKRKSGRVAAAVSAGAVACDDHQEFHDTARNSGAARLVSVIRGQDRTCMSLQSWASRMMGTGSGSTWIDLGRAKHADTCHSLKQGERYG